MSVIIFDFSELRGRIKTKYGTESDFASALELSAGQLSDRLNNKSPFRGEEIIRACELLDISADLIGFYFFTQKVR